MPEHFVDSLAWGLDSLQRKNLLRIDFSSLPIDFRLEQIVLLETQVGNGPA